MGQSVDKRFDSLVKYCSVSLRGSVKKNREMEECAFRLASIIKRHQPTTMRRRLRYIFWFTDLRQWFTTWLVLQWILFISILVLTMKCLNVMSKAGIKISYWARVLKRSSSKSRQQVVMHCETNHTLTTRGLLKKRKKENVFFNLKEHIYCLNVMHMSVDQISDQVGKRTYM